MLTRILILLCACSLAGYLASVSWFFDLFNHYRPQAVAAALFFLLFALLGRNKKHLILVLTILVLNIPPLVSALQAFPHAPSKSTPASDSTITIISANVLTSNSHYAALLALIAALQPDIVVLTEVDATWCRAMTNLQAEYPYAITLPRPDNFGMAVYAKQPFVGRNITAGRHALPLIVAEFEDFVLLAAHPLPPISADNVRDLRDYLTDAAAYIRTSVKPLALAGDLNATLWSDTLEPLKGLGLHRTNKHALAWTWPSIAPPLAIQIDHIMVRGLEVNAFTVLPGIGSDHFPIMVRLIAP